MWIIRIIIPLLTLTLCNAIGPRWREQIKPLPDKQLLTGQEANIQNALEPKTTSYTEVPATVTIRRPSDALVDENFEKCVFTSSLINHPLQQKLAMTDGNKFVIAEIEATVGGRKLKTFALQFAKQDEVKAQRAYWVPQGGRLQYGGGSSAEDNPGRPYVDIPIRPTEDDPHFVFTPDFSGCSLTISTFRKGPGGMDGFLRIRHVEGGKEDAQFNRLSAEEKGDPVYAMQYKDYGYYQYSSEIINNIGGFAFMYYRNKHWSIVYQHNQNPQTIGKAVFDTNTRLMSASLTQLQNEIGQPITYVAGFKEFVIPYCIFYDHRDRDGNFIPLSACG